MEGFGIEKLSLVLVIVLVLFGARRIPEIGGSIGKGIREFKRGMRDIQDDADRDTDASRVTGLASDRALEDATPDGEPKRLI